MNLVTILAGASTEVEGQLGSSGGDQRLSAFVSSLEVGRAPEKPAPQ